MKSCLIFVVIVALGISCSQNNKASQQKTQAEDTTHYFQVAQYIQKQIEEVQKTPYFIYKIQIQDGVKDSVPINTPSFTQIAQEFIDADINKPSLKKNYKENIFHDETTKTFTISYTTPDKDLEVQTIDVLLQEDGQTVKRIFIRKFKNNPDSSVIKQLSWKADENFQINKLVQTADKKETSQQTIVVWNEK